MGVVQENKTEYFMNNLRMKSYHRYVSFCRLEVRVPEIIENFAALHDGVYKK